jgi:hypothetical protein
MAGPNLSRSISLTRLSCALGYAGAANVALGSLTFSSERPRKRATRISMSSRSRGSWRQVLSHQSGNIAECKKSLLKPALDNRFVRLLKVCLVRGLLHLS